jgi:hypothetical protein
VLLLRAHRAAPGRGRNLLLAGALVAFWLAAAARANGVVAVALALLLVGPADLLGLRARGRLRQVARHVAIAGALTLVIVGTQALWTNVVVQPVATFPQQPTYQFDLAALSVRTNQMLLPPSSLKPGVGLDDLAAHLTYNHSSGSRQLWYNADAPVVFQIRDPALEHQLERAWRSAILHHPVDYLRHRLAFTAGLLGLSSPYAHGSLIDDGSRPETFGFDEPFHDRYFPSIYRPVSDWLKDLESTDLVRGWWIVTVLIGASAVLGVRDAESRLLLGSGLGSLATFAAFGVAGNFRYLWFTSICMLVLVTLVLDRWSRGRAHRAPPVGDGSGTEAIQPAVLVG